jgi:hypothetical protein
MTIDFKSAFGSKVFRWVLVGIGLLIILLVVFKAGEFVGSRKGDFSRRWDDNYYRNFMGPRTGFPMMGMGSDVPMMGHGIAGSVISVASSTFVVRGSDTVERIISFTGETRFQRFREDMQPSELKTGDNVIVLGSPDEVGQIVAKFVRVVPELPVSPDFSGNAPQR